MINPAMTSLMKNEGGVEKVRARILTNPEFERLSQVPPEAQWFAN